MKVLLERIRRLLREKLRELLIELLAPEGER
jgi:hypothetical protein